MVDPGASSPWGCDAAALHPDLRGQDPDENPFRACAALREELKRGLQRHLAIASEVFLLANTSQALATAVAGLALDGYALTVAPPCYADYAALPAWPATAGLRAARLVTRVDPLTGTVTPVEPGPPHEGVPVVVDAAQSFATLRHHAAALSADVAIAPLHKHAGIAMGLGLLAVGPGRPLPALRSLAAMAERGAPCRPALEAAVAAVAACDGRLVNRAVIELGPRLRRSLEGRGIAVLTPPGAALPFVCLRGLDPASLPAAGPSGLLGPLSFKLFRREGVLRVSAATRGRLGDDPDDLSGAAEHLLGRAAAMTIPDGGPR